MARLQTCASWVFFIIIVFMIEFHKNAEKIVPYNREQYIRFLYDNEGSADNWFGVSFQLYSDRTKYSVEEFVKIYEPLFKNAILHLDDGSFWMVNHDDKDLKWFPNDEDTLVALRFLFEQSKIPNTFRGALFLNKDMLLELAKELISYPSGVFSEENVLYKNLDVSHSKLPFIIKISGHLCIDFLSTDKNLLRNFVSENSSVRFIVKQYRGTSL